MEYPGSKLDETGRHPLAAAIVDDPAVFRDLAGGGEGQGDAVKRWEVKASDDEDRSHLNVWDFYQTLPRPRSVWMEIEEEPIAWYWKLWGYGGMAVAYSGFVGYIVLTFWAMIYYAYQFVSFAL
ncbi:hypothetical protein [Aneurinibacillus aneurinilyticus]|uniref:Uncharacterized protein n=1 Tax=Aneurinibacillus aneurinilyticus ATCC 12856 TaxID=649747 RepID=U1WXC5_ANEAE|nr:hypothetical protein [Aneurinibacillus aneurinilyticus]ERI07330.1 hypothetical protein HMPREF0083_04614 [Aneurinibacillus aneurinilyticus ATCC 12856]MED0709695.1 hypothetical protein [Aneurinibacillus aneurinilyticus]MED0726455.1 hypothetical protein [Aneurinibacillus aneurinilyticus]MED0734927.1 hypothetical protein [Aneurinibacillus aneurinilyticus]MED0741835.1 hypothetical protein [Aneurinibacillus aneurinilyticus]